MDVKEKSGGITQKDIVQIAVMLAVFAALLSGISWLNKRYPSSPEETCRMLMINPIPVNPQVFWSLRCDTMQEFKNQ